MPMRVAVAVFLCAVAGGCRPVWRPPLVLPGQYQLVRNQLVVHSDFPLAAHHRLVEDLIARREDLSRHLALPVSDEPIAVYLFEKHSHYDAFVRANYPDFPARRAIFVESDTRLTVYAQWGDRVAEDLRHEVTHGYLHAVLPGIPLWLDEGLAEYYETPRGTQGVNPQHLAWLGPRLANGWQGDLWRLEQLPPTAAMNEGDYAEAWAWVHLLLQSQPDNRELLRAYLSDLRRDGQTEPLSARLRAAWGDPAPALASHLHRVLGGGGSLAIRD